MPTDTIRRLAREFAGTKPAVAEGQRGIAAHSNATATAHALTILNIASIDVFLGESTMWADVVPPAATYLESWDVATNFNSPGVIGLRRLVVSPLGEARPTAEILLALARRLNLDFFGFTCREFVAEGVRAWGTTLKELEAR